MRLLLKFLRITGLRCSEGIESFNLIISLSNQGKLNEYLSADGIIEHFRFKTKFLRGTKNAFISIVPESLITEIGKSLPVTYRWLSKGYNGVKLNAESMNSAILLEQLYFNTVLSGKKSIYYAGVYHPVFSSGIILVLPLMTLKRGFYRQSNQ